MKNQTVQIGTARCASPTEHATDFMQWLLVDIGGRLARVGSVCHDSVKVPSRADRAAVEKKYGGVLVGVLLEPTYDRNGYYDPPGGFYWEDEYVAALQTHSEKIGSVAPSGFTQCPECGAGHTATTRSCRTCGYRMSA